MSDTTSPAALAATHAAAFAGGEVWSADTIAALIATSGVILTGDARAFALGRVVAGEAEILTLATHPDHRRHGLARAVLATLESRARTQGAEVIFLEVDTANTAARALYAAAGYGPAGLRRGYYRHADGQASDALVLRKVLDPVGKAAPGSRVNQDSG